MGVSPKPPQLAIELQTATEGRRFSFVVDDNLSATSNVKLLLRELGRVLDGRNTGTLPSSQPARVDSSTGSGTADLDGVTSLQSFGHRDTTNSPALT